MRMHDFPPASSAPCPCTALRKASRALSRAYDAALAGTGLNIGQLGILRAIERAGDPPISRLAETMVMDRTSLYRALTPMVRSGWVQMANEPSGRAKRVALTEEGLRVTHGAAEAWDEAQARFLSAFGANRWASVHEDLFALAALGVELNT